MASITRYQNPPVTDALRDEPYSFDFDQAILVLEHMHKYKQSNNNMQFESLGESLDLSHEALTIKSHVSFSTPASELQKLDIDQEKPALWINFLSLAGVLGPLPTPYTEMVIDRTRSKNTSFRDFLDIFNHRIASMWHRLHKKVYVGIAQVLPQHSNIGKCLLRLAGISHEKIIQGTELNESALLTYQNLFWKQPHGTISLEQMIHHHFNVKAKIHEFIGAWRHAIPDEITRIGMISGQWNTLGENVVLGSKCWDQMAGIRIDIGPLTWERFCEFLPLQNHTGKHHYHALKDLCRLYVGIDFSINAKLILDRNQIKPVVLQSQLTSPKETSFHLGLNTWLYSKTILEKNVSTCLTFEHPY
ncbi:MAG: type VI secretion system baseplate subunit TssG [Candidatus Paracaedibacteraceae bacterium]|nr:type VI secretion system baseplate subunit TssG [Candidatus Paracaedibacteraceae bacterium]